MNFTRFMSGLATGIFLLLPSVQAEQVEKNTIAKHAKEWMRSPQEGQRLLKLLKKGSAAGTVDLRKVIDGDGGLSKASSSDPAQIENLVFRDEEQFQDIQREVLNPWIKSWLAKDVKSFSLLLNQRFKGDRWSTSMSNGVAVTKNIKQYQWSKSSILSSRKTQLQNFKKYLSQYQKIEDLELSAFSFAIPSKNRDKMLMVKKAEIQIQYDIRGIGKDGLRRQDRGPLQIEVSLNKTGNWKLDKISLWGLKSLAATKATFTEVTAAAGLSKVREYQRIEAIRRGGYAVSVHDYDKDGIQDLYIGAHGPGTLLKGKKNGTFDIVKNSGLGQDEFVKGAIFADFNNDNNPDLLLARFVPDHPEFLGNSPHRNDVVIYQGDGNGKFKRTKRVHDDKVSGYAMPAAVADFDNDGWLDFYIGYPGPKDFTITQDISHKKDLQVQGLYTNVKNMTFHGQTLNALNEDNYKEYLDNQKIFPHSAMSVDFDQDGDMDIIVVDDRGHLSPAYRNNGKGKFVQAAKNIGMENRGFGMGTAAGDFNNDGKLDFLLSNVNFVAADRIQSIRNNWDGNLKPIRDNEGLRVFQGIQKGKYSDVTKAIDLSWPGEGLAGIEFIDYNNDGFLDIYVANGLWPGTDKEQNLSSLFVRRTFRSDDDERTFMEVRPEKTQSMVMDILSSFQGDIASTKRDSKKRPHLAGHQRNRLYLNNKNGTFTEVGYLEGVDSIADGYIIAKADIDRDGDLDLILRNADPGSKEVNFPAVQIFRNENGGASLRVQLTSTTSNTDAIGSEVVVKAGGITQTQQLIANNGTAQSEGVLHFGLGNSKIAEEVIVRWPSGQKQIFKNVKPGYFKVQEKSKILKKMAGK